MVNAAKLRAWVRRCHLGMVFGALIGVVCLAVCWWLLKLPMFQPPRPALMLGLLVFVVALRLVFFRLAAVLLPKLEVKALPLGRRNLITNYVVNLARRSGKQAPTITVSGGGSQQGSALNAGMLDLLAGTDAMLVGQRLTELLTDTELKAVLAHEWYHKDGLHTKCEFVLGVTSSMLWWMFFLTLVGVGPNIGFYATLCNIGVYLLFAQPFRVSRAFAARCAEFRSDAGSLSEIGHYLPLITALRKMEHVLKIQQPEKWKARQKIGWLQKLKLSHPSTDAREQALKPLMFEAPATA